MKKTCKFEGCERKHSAKGWCAAHYHQWNRTGETKEIGSVGRPAVPTVECKVDGCGRTVNAKGYCNRHYNSEYYLQGKAKKTTARKTFVGIKAAHKRVMALLGKASNYPCSQPGCEKDALDWALNHEYADDIITPIGLEGVGSPYSLIKESYFPLCRRHHMIYDGTLGLNHGKGRVSK